MKRVPILRMAWWSTLNASIVVIGGVYWYTVYTISTHLVSSSGRWEICSIFERLLAPFHLSAAPPGAIDTPTKVLLGIFQGALTGTLGVASNAWTTSLALPGIAGTVHM